MTRGLRVRGLVEKHRKLPVLIAPEFCAPVGEHAGKFASQIGVQVRTNLSTMNAYSWKNIDSGEKEAIIQNVADQFDIQGESVLVNKSLNTKCGKLLSSHYYKLFTKYKKLVKDEGSTYARNHPPKNVTREKWIELIDGKWSDEDWPAINTSKILITSEKVSTRNARNRNKEGMLDKHIHRCGNKSLAIRVDERRKNGGHIPKLAQVYYDTHFNLKTKQWVHHDCEHTYQEMLRVQDEHCSTLEAQPLTEEEISMMVLKSRSGYVKGLGMRPSSSLRTLASSSSTPYTQQLEGRVEEFQDANYKLEGRVEELQDANFRPEEKMDCIIQYLRSKGDNDICGSGGSSSTN
ncbi:uncharacterized protein LOC126725075 isoform X2 [Quercus robur]|uniref:uncharacterized protein LOC126725075 isoform X2 n=1 Tax=Quercus robur TaxID=38942 RepID=UPI002162DB18|nr:uncharacterized protein LOC126725075 isoform X2 [Quercus robur]